MKMFGIEIERKTDILAFAAFVMSVGGLLMQMINLIKGPDIVMEPPRQILIESIENDKKITHIRFSAKLIYLNKGSPGYDDIVKSETAVVIIGDRNIQFQAIKYIVSKVENNKLKIASLSDADPVQVKSGQVVSHETYFVPWPSKPPSESNFIEFDDFISMLNKHKEMVVYFKSVTFSGAEIHQKCNVDSKAFIYKLIEKKWSAPVCDGNYS